MKHTCKICKKEVTNNNSYIGSHVKRKHGITLEEYLSKYEIPTIEKEILHIPHCFINYTNVTSEEFKLEKCGFCDNIAKPELNANYEDKTYYFAYNKGFFCGTIECKNQISQDFLGTPYNKKTFEHIGAKSEYIAKLWKRSIDDVKYTKSKGFRESNFRCDLESYIEKYGSKLGKQKYDERCQKISKSNNIEWYVEKYGKELGEQKWNHYISLLKPNGSTVSKKQKIIEQKLQQLNINYLSEYVFTKSNGNIGYVDWYLPDHNIFIEYYGIYWHCKPTVYKHDYYHRNKKMLASEVWNADTERNKYLLETFKNSSIIIIWEDTIFSNEFLLKLINDIKNLNTVIEI